MKENVVQEWNEEQRKKKAAEEVAATVQEGANIKTEARTSESRLDRLKARFLRH
ncbi:hypothetical protein E8E12_008723 [Didymella heteroderae]|uniref:Uncharacterized protein n=1 Tax=Didymella heteroderae TaxID=1769908 RepID=A0A9P4WXS9_9PLEO|nr:hypothetical protein E8E12_008723 [Didymella heteroderae]